MFSHFRQVERRRACSARPNICAHPRAEAAEASLSTSVCGEGLATALGNTASRRTKDECRCNTNGNRRWLKETSSGICKGKCGHCAETENKCGEEWAHRVLTLELPGGTRQPSPRCNPPPARPVERNVWAVLKHDAEALHSHRESRSRTRQPYLRRECQRLATPGPREPNRSASCYGLS